MKLLPIIMISLLSLKADLIFASNIDFLGYGKPQNKYVHMKTLYSHNKERLGWYSLSTNSLANPLVEVTVFNATDCTLIIDGSFYNNGQVFQLLDWGNGFFIPPQQRNQLSNQLNSANITSSDEITFKIEGYTYDCQ